MLYKVKFLVICLISITKPLSSSILPQNVKDDGLIVELVNPVGKIRGHILQTKKGIDYFAFQDIPYAQPPVGPNRFKPPRPLNPWNYVIDTVANVKYCPQEDYGTEDCLVLNVYTPLKPGSNASLPVQFFIHGGSYVGGSGSINRYNPQYFIEQDIVVVTTNYRLGVLGFLTMDDENLPGNLGLKDQHFALKWTRENIHLFNGDPDHIIISGQSAGAMSVGQQFISQLNKGWIKGVISESGSGFGTIVIQPNYKEFAIKFGQILDPNFNSNSSRDLNELLLRASTYDIIRVQNETADPSGLMIWCPIIESELNQGALLTGELHYRILTGDFNLVPLLIGFNSEESLYFVRGWPDEQFAIASKIYDDDPRMLISQQLNVADETRKHAGLALKALYTSTSFVEDKAAFIRYFSDELFVRSIIRQAEGASGFVPVYLYEFSWNENPDKYSGIPHSIELAYLWDYPTNFPDITLNESLRVPMVKLWSNFIKTLNPTPYQDEDLQNIIWPTVHPFAVKYLNINKTFEILENPRRYYEIKNILDIIIRPPYNVY